MYKKKVLTLILAGGQGGRLEALSEYRAKPAVPYAGSYRLIDFSLSNCMNSKMSDIWMIVQYEPHLLNLHLSGGRPWDLDRTYGGLEILPPFENKTNNSKSGFAEGNADAIYINLKKIKQFNPDIVMVLSADHIYKLDYRDIIEEHLKEKADLTMVVTKVELKESVNFGNVKFDKKNIVTDFKYKPKKPFSEYVTTEIFVYDAQKLITTLEELSDKKGKNKTIKDFGDELIPYFVENYKCISHIHKGYWKDVGRVETYFQSHMELLNNKAIDLDNEWPIITETISSSPAKIMKTASIDNSLISQGSYIEGEIINSVLSPGVKVAKGSKIVNSIIHENTFIDENTQIYNSIIDSEVKVGKKCIIGVLSNDFDNITSEDITLIGYKQNIKNNTKVKKGERLKAVLEE